MHSKRPRSGEGESAAERLAAKGYHVLGYKPRPVEVVHFDPEQHAEEWEGFLPLTATGNLFQARRFLAYHPSDRFVDLSLLFRRRGQLVAAAAGELADAVWSSHRFTSHAGLAVRRDLGAGACLDVVDALVEHARLAGWRRLWMRYAPPSVHEGDSDPLFWALEVHGFRSEGRELSWYFEPRCADQGELLTSYRGNARTAVRRALERGLCFGRSEDFGGFWKLLEASLEARFGVKPTHTLTEVERLRSLCPNEIELWAVHDPTGRLLAGALLFQLSATCTHTFYLAQDYSASEAQPMSRLMHGLAEEFTVRRGVRLNLGVITADRAQELNLGLSSFKQSFGARPSVRRSFALEIGGARSDR